MNSLDFKNSKYIKYEGRILVNNSISLFNSCSSIKFNFTGKKLILNFAETSKATIKIIINNDIEKYFITEKEVVVFDKEIGNYSIEIIRTNSHAVGGTIEILNILIDGEFNELKTENKIKLEFYGDSLTCGYMVNEDGSGDTITNEDGTLAYAYLLTKELNAECSIISRSGMSLVVPYWVEYILNDRYEYYYPTEEKYKWDFNLYTPDYVFINVGTNDQAGIENNKIDINVFIKGYVAFLNGLRKHYKEARIICSYGMAAKRDFIVSAINKALNEVNDKNIYFIELNEVDYSTITGHPTKKGYIECKNQILEFFNKIK